MAKEYTICEVCGLLIANEEMHASYHVWVEGTIGTMQAMINVIWEDAKLDKNKKVDPPAPPEPIDY